MEGSTPFRHGTYMYGHMVHERKEICYRHRQNPDKSVIRAATWELSGGLGAEGWVLY